MKKIFLQIILVINLFFISNCKAQTSTNYINFYNSVVTKLNSIIPNKTQYYGQNFSNFYNNLQSKNIDIKMLFCDYKTDPGTKYYQLKLFFCDSSMLGVARKNSFRYPRVIITFENEIPKQVDALINQYNAEWNNAFAQYFANMKIEKIEFIGVKGYNVEDWSE